MFSHIEKPKLSRRPALNHFLTATVLWCGVGGVAAVAIAQDGADDPSDHAWQAGAIAHAQRMRAFFDRNNDQQLTPPVILCRGALGIDADLRRSWFARRKMPWPALAANQGKV
jgi:hypothetical protein